jgi:hypothetical protein
MALEAVLEGLSDGRAASLAKNGAAPLPIAAGWLKTSWGLMPGVQTTAPRPIPTAATGIVTLFSLPPQSWPDLALGQASPPQGKVIALAEKARGRAGRCGAGGAGVSAIRWAPRAGGESPMPARRDTLARAFPLQEVTRLYRGCSGPRAAAPEGSSG